MSIQFELKFPATRTFPLMSKLYRVIIKYTMTHITKFIHIKPNPIKRYILLYLLQHSFPKLQCLRIEKIRKMNFPWPNLTDERFSIWIFDENIFNNSFLICKVAFLNFYAGINYDHIFNFIFFKHFLYFLMRKKIFIICKYLNNYFKFLRIFYLYYFYLFLKYEKK